jgi:hypothetical protein
VLDFLWHQKGAMADQGLQGLQQDWQDLGFIKAQAVVLELVLQMEDKGLNHVVWIDNLFTTFVTIITCIYHRQTSTMVLRPRISQPWYPELSWIHGGWDPNSTCVQAMYIV